MEIDFSPPLRVEHLEPELDEVVSRRNASAIRVVCLERGRVGR